MLHALMLSKVRTMLGVIALALLSAAPLAAQQTADVIRGRVTSPDSLPIVGAQITAVSFMGGITRTARTDRNGRFSITYPNGEGDYWVSIAAIGYQGQRFEVRRNADEEVLLANVRLSATQTLAAVNVTASGPRQPPPRTDFFNSDASGADRSIASGFVSPDMAGNLAAMATTTPGVQLIPGVDGNPDRFSIFGLDGSQNNATLNGQQNGVSNIPRDAGVSTQLRAGYDVANGGFSGAQIAVTTNSGTNYVSRSGSGVFNAPQAQWNDRVGQASSYSFVSLGGRASGPIVMDKDFYNVSFQFDHRSQNLATLLSNTPVVFQSAGISADSAARLRAILDQLGVPLSTSALGNNSPRTTANLLGTIDWAPKSPTSGQAINVAFNGTLNSSGPQFGSNASQTPASLASTKALSGSTQLRHTNYFGTGVLTESMFSVSGSTNSNSPYLDLSSGSVLVSSALPDGTITARSLGFGGGSNASTNNSVSLGARNMLSWFSANNRHRIKLITELRGDRAGSEQAFNLNGRYTYQSLGDLEAGKPSSFSRALNAVNRSGSELIGSVALGDAYRPSTNVQVQYGLRLDGNRFLSRPEENRAVESVFGASNRNVPNRVYVSPRLGFSWLYGTASQIPFADGFAYSPRATIRGGIGMFQNMRGPELASGAIASTGLAGSSQQLMCTGDATPIVPWGLMRDNAFVVPSACANGYDGTVFANSTPGVTLFDPHYAQEKSLRSNIGWGGTILNNRYNLNVNVEVAYNFHQPDALDLNFNGTQRFALDNEGGRPVYVRPSSIDPRSGLVTAADSRLSPQFNIVSEQRANLHSQNQQLTLSLSPFFFLAPRIRWNLTYNYLRLSQQYRGFSSTAASPFEIHTGLAAQPTHDIGYSLSYNLANAITFALGGRLTSGNRFTPTVAADVNGDGYRNDRAFIFDPANAGSPAVSAALQSLLDHGSGSARDCLRKQIGTFAARNSCVGPWTMGNTNLRITLNPTKVRLPQRTTLSFTISNAAGAADMLLHGTSRLHGWGQTPFIDQSLLFVRGFDVATSRYVYEVNQRFGSTRATQTTSRTPVVLTLQMGVDLAPTRDWQNLRQQLDRGRNRLGTKMNESQTRSYSANAFPNPMARILQAGELLHLTRTQADSLATLARRYTRLVDSVWTPAAKFYAAMPKAYDRTDAQERLIAAREVAVGYLITVVPGVKSMLTKGQLRVLSSGIANMLETRYLELMRMGQVGAENSFFFF